MSEDTLEQHTVSLSYHEAYNTRRESCISKMAFINDNYRLSRMGALVLQRGRRFSVLLRFRWWSTPIGASIAAMDLVFDSYIGWCSSVGGHTGSVWVVGGSIGRSSHVEWRRRMKRRFLRITDPPMVLTRWSRNLPTLIIVQMLSNSMDEESLMRTRSINHKRLKGYLSSYVASYSSFTSETITACRFLASMAAVQWDSNEERWTCTRAIE